MTIKGIYYNKVMKIMFNLLIILSLLSCSSEYAYKENTDITMLAKIATIECGNCSTHDKILVISSVLNRLDHLEFPNTVDSVLTQEKQYASLDIMDSIDHESLVLANLIYNGVLRDCNVLYFSNYNASKQMLKYLKKNHYITTKKQIYGT